jgi:hypothetical protein
VKATPSAPGEDPDDDLVDESVGEEFTHEVSIRPGVGMLGLFPHMRYRAWYAVGELVDNAIQSYLANRDRLRDADGPSYHLKIEISISKEDGGSVVVRDNAAGIAASDWGRAFKVAEPPADASGLSQFGVGMKAACCWFAREWSLRTTHLGDTAIRSVVFDVPQIIASREETLKVVEAPTDWRSHFTEIRMWDLHRTPQKRTLGKMREYLGSMYRQFIRNGDVEILFNGQLVEYDEATELEAARWTDLDGVLVHWRKDVDIRLESGRRVRGFAALREKGSTSDAGLALLYRGKVVTGAGEDMYKPDVIFGRSNSFRSQRLFGELIMDDFSVVYTKDALVWYDEEDEFVDLLRDQLDAEPLPLLRQAENYRVRRPDPVPDEIVNEMLNRIVDLIPVDLVVNEIVLDETDDVEDDVEEDVEEQTPSVAAPKETATVAPVTRTTTISVNDRPWHVTLHLVADEANGDWLSVQRLDQIGQSTLEIAVNRAVPFMRNFAEVPSQELEPVWRLAVAVGLAQELARDGGAKYPNYVVMKLNMLLREHLSRQV